MLLNINLQGSERTIYIHTERVDWFELSSYLKPGDSLNVHIGGQLFILDENSRDRFLKLYSSTIEDGRIE